MDVYFTDVFRVDETHVDSYGAFNVSVVNDLPLFVDPFLLFNGANPTYQQMHEAIIGYVCFLRDRVVDAGPNGIARGLITAWFYFPEVKQNWFGYSLNGNSGHGLGDKFAKSLIRNLGHVFTNFGNEEISKSSHLEKLSLIDDGIGRDMISDFTTNMIKRFLCEYTQQFARQFLAIADRRQLLIKKVWFNYDTRTWVDESFELPFYQGTFVLLTPKDILTKDETWINRPDLLQQAQQIVDSAGDAQLRHQFNQYLALRLAKAKTNRERLAAVSATLQEFPQVLDFYIRTKEDRGGQAESISQRKVQFTYDRYVGQIRRFVTTVLEPSQFYLSKEPIELLVSHRLGLLKVACESIHAADFLYTLGSPVSNQEELSIIMRLIWAANPADGRSNPASIDESFQLMTFKLASNPKIVEATRKFLDEEPLKERTVVIFAFTQIEAERISSEFTSGKFRASDRIVCIHAFTDPWGGPIQPISRDRRPQMTKCRILMLAANPEGTTKLALDEESREIGMKLRGSDFRDDFDLIVKSAVRPGDLLQYLNQYKPHVVHFSGHGSSSNELIFLDVNRQPQSVSEEALTQLFTTLKDNIRLVVLNACYSQAQALAIARVIDCTVGMKRSIGDEAAISFAAWFYGAIGFGRSIQEAFDQGRTAIMLEGIPEQDTPDLITRSGINASSVFLVDSHQ